MPEKLTQNPNPPKTQIQQTYLSHKIQTPRFSCQNNKITQTTTNQTTNKQQTQQLSNLKQTKPQIIKIINIRTPNNKSQ